MKIRLFILGILALGFFFVPNNSLGQWGGVHAELIEVNHYCGDMGMVEVNLLNSSEIQSYYWEHGPTELQLSNLLPGFYTFVIILKNGCTEKHDVQIIDVENCEIETKQIEISPCEMMLVIEVSFNGILVDEADLNIIWEDGNHAGLTRIITRDIDELFCVEITAAGGGHNCCYLNECFFVEKNEDCKERRTKAKVIVNEFSKNVDGKPGYVELLVLGDGFCEESYDIRGHILDDNNGFLIPVNDFINQYNTEITGISMGYLQFTMHENWQKVPNGSLILIVQERGEPDSETPPLDPFDSNGDNVFVVPADDLDLFVGKTGYWNNDEKIMKYQGIFTSPSWDKIKLQSDSDGMQVRYPDGSFCHGVARGETPFSDSSIFTLYLTNESFNTGNVRFIKENYMAKEGFMYSEIGGDLQSPGKPNSIVNNEIIMALLDCQNLNREEYINDIESDDERQVINTKEGLSVYPNPFTSDISIDFTSELEGIGELKLYTISGMEILSETLNCFEGRNYYQLRIEKNTASNLFILRLSYPSGKQEYKRIIHLF